MGGFIRRPAPSPNFDKGWRLGVAIGASLVLMAIAAISLLIVGKMWDGTS